MIQWYTNVNFICHAIDCMACNILNRKSPGRRRDIGMIVSRKPSLYMTRHCCTQVVLYWFYSNELCKFVELAWLHIPRAEKKSFSMSCRNILQVCKQDTLGVQLILLVPGDCVWATEKIQWGICPEMVDQAVTHKKHTTGQGRAITKKR